MPVTQSVNPSTSTRYTKDLRYPSTPEVFTNDLSSKSASECKKSNANEGNLGHHPTLENEENRLEGLDVIYSYNIYIYDII